MVAESLSDSSSMGGEMHQPASPVMTLLFLESIESLIVTIILGPYDDET